jgi:hypothetical protein
MCFVRHYGGAQKLDAPLAKKNFVGIHPTPEPAYDSEMRVDFAEDLETVGLCMQAETQTPPRRSNSPDDLSLLSALRDRRSRRFGRGMKIPAGPLAYESKHPPVPLTEDEEAALVFAACGITGHALADLAYARGEGGNIMGGLVARTIASGDGLQTVALVVTNDTGTHLVRRPSELPAARRFRSSSRWRNAVSSRRPIAARG